MNEQRKAREDNPKQSDAFRRAVQDLEDAGDLDSEKGAAVLDGLLQKKADKPAE